MVPSSNLNRAEPGGSTAEQAPAQPSRGGAAAITALQGRSSRRHSPPGALRLKATKTELESSMGTQPLPEYDIPGAEPCQPPTEGVGCTLPPPAEEDPGRFVTPQ